MTKRSLDLRASGVTAWNSARVDGAGAAALHLLEVGRARTSRRKNTHSSGLTSVPVAIMSTVTAIRSSGLLRNALDQCLRVVAVRRPCR